MRPPLETGEVSTLTGLTPDHVRRLARAGVLRTHAGTTTRYLFDAADVERWIAERAGAEVGVVYLIQQGDDGPVKIGWTRDEFQVWSRLASFQTGNPTTLHLRGLIPGGRHLECELHERYAAARVCGEWFAVAPAEVNGGAP